MKRNTKELFKLLKIFNLNIVVSRWSTYLNCKYLIFAKDFQSNSEFDIIDTDNAITCICGDLNGIYQSIIQLSHKQ